MYEDKYDKKASSVKYEESAGEADFDTHENASPAVDLRAEIVENNTELTEKIVQAIALTNSIDRLTSNANSDPLNLERLLSLTRGNAIVSATALGTIPLTEPTAPAGQEFSLMSLLVASSHLLTPNDLALPLNDPSIFLPTPFAPGENANTLSRQQRNGEASMHDIPMPPPAEPSVPIPAANPRQDFLRHLAAVQPSPAPIPTPCPRQDLLHHLAAVQPPQDFFLQLAAVQPSMARISAANPRRYLLHQLAASAMQPHPASIWTAQQDLLHQIAATYGVGGQHTACGTGGSSRCPPATAEVRHSPGLNHHPGTAGCLPAGYNHSGFNHPGIAARVPTGYNPAGPRKKPLTNTGILSQHSTITDCSTYSSLATQACSSNRALLSQQPMIAPNPESSASRHTQDKPASCQNSSPENSIFPSSEILAPVVESADPVKAAALATQAARKEQNSYENKTVDLINGRRKKKPARSDAEGRVSTSSSVNKGDELFIKSREARWIVRYNELLEFRVEYGHCRVPHGYSQNRRLSWWVMNQRAQFAHRNQGRKTWLTDERIQLLNDAGFIWTPHLKRSSGRKNKETTVSSGEDKNELKICEHISMCRKSPK